MDIGEITETPAFWLLGGGGSIAVVTGYIISRKSGWEVLPLWQMIVIILTVLVASAYFATKD